MNPNTISYLEDLKNNRDDWTIKVRIVRLWESIHIYTKVLLSLDMILIDEEVTQNKYY